MTEDRDCAVLVRMLLQLITCSGAACDTRGTCSVCVALEAPLRVRIADLVETVQAVWLALGQVSGVGGIGHGRLSATARLQRIRPSRVQLLIQRATASGGTDAAVVGTLIINVD